MAIVKMKKLTLAAPRSDRDELLRILQGIGCVELVDLKEEELNLEGAEVFKDNKTVSQTQLDYNQIKFTYEFLKNYRAEKDGMFKQRENITKDEFYKLESKIAWKEISRKARELDEKLNFNKNEAARLNAQIDQYSVWANLDVSNEYLSKFKKVSYSIGTVQKKFEAQVFEELNKASKEIYIEKISEKQQDLNIFVMYYKPEAESILEVLKKYGFSKLNIELDVNPSKAIEEFKEKINLIKEENQRLIEEAKELSKSIKDIEKINDFLVSKLQVEEGLTKTIKTNKTFILNGWIPEENINELEKAINVSHGDAYLVLEDPTEEDAPPVALKNNMLSEPFEAVTSMYALPLPTESDPTPIIAPFFLLFFGMMMADIGYGILMLIASAVMLLKMDLTGDLKKIVKLILYCSFPTIIFGALYGGFFGGIIPLKPIWVNPVDDPMKVLLVSVAIGIVHLFTGLGIKAYGLIKSGNFLDALMDVGSWYLLLIGLIWMLVGGLANIPGANIGKILAIIGAAAIVLTQGRSNKTIFGKLIGGIYSLYGVTGYLGDALSYSRLLALGLSSGLIGWSFNLLINLVNGPAKIIAGPLIFVAGHLFNFLIGGLGTYVHSSRLIYLEFFGKFYEGGGKVFQPLRISTKYIKLNSEK